MAEDVRVKMGAVRPGAPARAGRRCRDIRAPVFAFSAGADSMSETPRTIGPYRLTATLGEGRMGVVYRAVHRETGAVVALKTVRDLTPPLMEGVRREIRALLALGHPGVVRIVETGVEGLTPWFAMELLGERTLTHFAAELWGQWRRTENGKDATLVDSQPPGAARAAVPPPAAPPRRPPGAGPPPQVD